MKTSIGLDIGSHSLKLIELAFEKQRPILTNFTMSNLDNRTLKEAILDLITNTKIAKGRVNLGIKGPSVIVRYIQMPKMKDEELKGAIGFEAEKYIPFNLDEVIIDYEILEKEPYSNNMRVLLVAAKREHINNILELMKEVKLEVGIIDVDSFALINAFMNSGPNSEGMKEGKSTYALLNIGSKITNLNIISKRLVFFTRDIMWAGEEMTSRIKEKFNIGFKEAEALKIEPGEKAAQVKESLNYVLEKIIGEIRLSFDYFESQYEKNIERLFLSGGSSYLFNIIEALKEGLGLEVQRWDPFGGMRISKELRPDELKAIGSHFAVAVGLALRG